MPHSASCRVVIAEDHHVVRRGLATVLNHYPTIEVVGEAANGIEAVDMATQLQPDVVLMDLQMPEMDGAEATRMIKSQHPEIKIIILTMHDTDSHIFSGIQSGADSYLLKDVQPDELADAICAVRRGEWTVQPRIASRVLARLSQMAREDTPHHDLSERELEVLSLVAKGLANKAIGDRLFISENTVRSHLYHIFDKLGARDRTQAVLEAARRGLIKL